MIYLDNAATSWPKPREVPDAMADFLNNSGGNPGRSGHRLSIAAGRIVYNAREALAGLFHSPDPLRVILTSSGTHAINIALRGLLKPGERVVTTGIEHNAVMRPLRRLEKEGVGLTVVSCTRDSSLDPTAMAKAIGPGVRLIVMTHASNVTGTVLPVAKVAEMAHRVGALLLVDAAQTAGVIPIDVQDMGIDLLAFTGHKGLQGPAGTGGLVLGSRVDAHALEPLICGGTGSKSEFQEQPEDLPDRFESGTPNGPGIAGLGAGVRLVMERGIDAIREYELRLASALIEGLQVLPGVTLYGPSDPAARTGTVSFTVADRRVSEMALRLDEEYGILCRVGLHCAPAAHRTLGTFPEGTVRFSPGLFSTMDDIHSAVDAVGGIVK